MTAQLQQVLDAIDAANAADPSTEPDETGSERPKALLYGQRMSAELDLLYGGDVPDVLKIAARGQHIERWRVPRSDYPEGKPGYLNWRRDQGRAHGERLAGLMRDAGYPEADCERVGVLLRKEGLKRDEDVQRLEDVICFTFMRWYLKDFAAKHPEDKVLDIVTKTARKMSDDARARAVGEFDLTGAYASPVAPAVL